MNFNECYLIQFDSKYESGAADILTTEYTKYTEAEIM